MGARLVRNENNSLIKMGELKDGQLAIIVDERYNYSNQIVQRYGDHCVCIGREAGAGWSYVTENNSLLVRVLTTGELIEII